jgi:hypothetical protein
MVKIATIRPLMKIRAQVVQHRRLRFACAIHIKTDAREYERNQNERHRTPEEAHPEQPDRLLQRILGDLSENDADDEGRAWPVMAFEEIADSAHHHDEDQVLPVAPEQVATEKRENEHIGNEEGRLHRAELADPWPCSHQHDHADHIGDDERPDQRPDNVDMLGQHGGSGLDTEHQERAQHDRHA